MQTVFGFQPTRPITRTAVARGLNLQPIKQNNRDDSAPLPGGQNRNFSVVYSGGLFSSAVRADATSFYSHTHKNKGFKQRYQTYQQSCRERKYVVQCVIFLRISEHRSSHILLGVSLHRLRLLGRSIIHFDRIYSVNPRHLAHVKIPARERNNLA